MSRDPKDGRILIKGDKARDLLLKGAKFAYDAVTPTYGAKGTNVMIEKDFGRPLTTRDGVTVSRDTYTSDRPINMGAQRVMEASETTNRIAGDGTTATVALTYNLFKRGDMAIRAGTHPMEVKRQLLEDSYKVLDHLNTLTKPVKKGQLLDVAKISSGDEMLGQLIAEAVEKVGSDGGIITEKAPIEDVEREYVDGYYLQSGFHALQAGKRELIDPLVVVAIKRLSSSADAIEILTKTAQSQGLQPGTIPRILFVGNIEDAAYNVIVENVARGTIDAVILKTPPTYGDMAKQLLEDIAVYAGCTPITDSTNLRLIPATVSGATPNGQFTSTGTPTFRMYVGNIDRVVANKSDATLFADNSRETVQTRLQEIKDQLDGETVDAIAEKLKDRIAKLEGKIALFKIGGATDSIKEEVEFRVEDAINATRAAFTDGIVAGGGATLIELSTLDISEAYKLALHDTFKRLLENANLPVELKLDEVLKAGEYDTAFNLRGNGELVNMIKEGILDPALVVKQVIKNATAAATDMLTTATLLVFEDKKAE